MESTSLYSPLYLYHEMTIHQMTQLLTGIFECLANMTHYYACSLC